MSEQVGEYKPTRRDVNLVLIAILIITNTLAVVGLYIFSLAMTDTIGFRTYAASMVCIIAVLLLVLNFGVRYD